MPSPSLAPTTAVLSSGYRPPRPDPVALLDATRDFEPPSVTLVYAAETREQRKRFTRALEHLRAGRDRDFEQLRRELDDYALAPYLDYYAILRRSNELGVTEVQAFRQQFADTPLPRLLTYYWLRQAAEKRRWSVLAEAPVDLDGDARVVCQQAVARLRAGRREEALALAPVLWTVPRSQHERCDPLFDAWRKAGGIDADIAWKRLRLVLGAGDRRLARYLVRFFPEDLAPDAERLIQAHANPADTLTRFLSRPATAYPAAARDIPLLALERLARNRPERAHEQLQALRDAGLLETDDVRDAEGKVVTRLWLERSTVLDDYQPLTATPSAVTLEYLARHQLRQGDWPALLATVETMPADMRASDRWRYWRGRALVGLGRAIEGDAVFFALAEQRSFYGFAAAERVDQPLQMNDTGSPLAPERLEATLRLPAVQRTIELMALDRRTEARREWRALSNRLDGEGRRAMAHVARLHGWHRLAIQATIDGELWDDLALRFPVAYLETLQDAARENGLSPTWLLAIMRQESAMLPEARSPVGALGLMQLMPGTAAQVARSLGKPVPSASALRDPGVNVPLGAAYFADMLETFSGNRALAAAAYNAGPHRVRRWLDASGDVPLDIFIESIPYRETRGYVQNVLAFSSIYAYRMNILAPLTYPEEQQVAAGP